MTTITPPPPPPPAPLPGVPRALPTVIVANPPEALTKLIAGTQFEGTVSVAGSRTAVQLTTVYGMLQVQTTLPLEAGAKLNLILQNLTLPLQLQIAAINGKIPPAALRSAPGAPSQATPQAAIWPAATIAGEPVAGGPSSLVGTAATLTLLRPPVGQTVGPGTAAPPGATASANAGQSVTVTPATTTGPVATTATPSPPNAAPAAATTQSATAAAMGTAAPPKGGPATPGPAAQPLVQGTQLPTRIAALHLPGPNTPPSLAPLAAGVAPTLGQTVTAVVGTTTSQGQPIVQTPFGPATLSVAAPLPRGTELTLEIAGTATPPEAVRRPPTPLSPVALLNARDWPTLREAFDVLQQVDPGTAHQLATQTLPRPDSHLTASLLFFVSALRGGDVAGWLGEQALRDIQRTRPQLASRLGEEFRQIGALARDSLAGDWRIALIPFFAEREPEQLRLFLKPYGGGEDAGGPQGIRFIIDVDLSRLGHMQLDGLVRDDKKRLDLIVRSERPLPAEMQNDIRQIFAEAAELTGVDGGVSFQAAPPDFIEVTAAPNRGEGPDIVA